MIARQQRSTELLAICCKCRWTKQIISLWSKEGFTERILSLWLFTKWKTSVRNLKIKIIKQYAINLSKKSNYEFISHIYQVISQSVCEIIIFDNIIWGFISLSNEHGATAHARCLWNFQNPMGFRSTSKYPAIVALSKGCRYIEIGSRTSYVQMGISFLVIYILWRRFVDYIVASIPASLARNKRNAFKINDDDYGWHQENSSIYWNGTDIPTGDRYHVRVADIDDMIPGDGLRILRFRMDYEWSDTAPSRQNISSTNWRKQQTMQTLGDSNKRSPDSNECSNNSNKWFKKFTRNL